uniref:Uncharacterized protein n=1 Tax=Anguilla anguilla TaxID=7936 RepID=A0A0E9RXU1_ANGAN
MYHFFYAIHFQGHTLQTVKLWFSVNDE